MLGPGICVELPVILGIASGASFGRQFRRVIFPQAQDVPGIQAWTDFASACSHAFRYEDAYLAMMLPFAQAFSKLTLFLTTTGHLGICQSACRGDRTARVTGHQWPVPLRRQSSCHRVVGECDVAGWAGTEVVGTSREEVELRYEGFEKKPWVTRSISRFCVDWSLTCAAFRLGEIFRTCDALFRGPASLKRRHLHPGLPGHHGARTHADQGSFRSVGSARRNGRLTHMDLHGYE